MKETILVTGGAGFLGFHVSKALLERGHQVVIVDNMLGGSKENMAFLMRNYPFSFKGFIADVTDYPKMAMIWKETRPTRIFHAACYPHEGLSVNSPYLVAGHSVGLGSMVVGSLACQTGTKVKRFVNCSSMARYGEQEKVPFTEDMSPNHKDPYGAFKYASDISMKLLCEYHDVQFVNLVPHNIYGPNQKYDDPFRNVSAIMINRVLQKKQPVIYGDGTQKRCFSYVGDLIEPIMKALFEDAALGHTINLGPSEPFIEINELAKLICNLAGMEFKPIYVGDRLGEVKHANCSSEKAQRLLGVKFETPLVDGLKMLFDWIKEQGPKPFIYHLPLEIKNEKTPKTWTEKWMSL